MPTLTIRNVPERLHARLAERAAAHGRTLADEARAVLDAALDAERPTPEAILAGLDAFRAALSPLPGDLDPVRIIREDRDSDHGRDLP